MKRTVRKEHPRLPPLFICVTGVSLDTPKACGYTGNISFLFNLPKRRLL